MPTAIEYDWRGVFAEEFDRAIAKESEGGFAPETWLKAGRGEGEGEPWWRVNGPDLARSFGDWFDSSGAKVWATPDGRPAIELGLRPMFGDVPVSMYIDVVLVLGSALVVVDLKSGSTKPKTDRQLGLYASGIQKTYGIRPRYGAYFMARGTGKDDERVYFQRPVPLDEVRYSVRYFTEQFAMLEQAVREQIFIANPGDRCRRCGVNYACLTAGGAEAGRY